MPFCPGLNVLINGRFRLSCYTTRQIRITSKFWELNNKLWRILSWIYLMLSSFSVLIYGQCKVMAIHVYLTLVLETVFDYFYKIYRKLCGIRYPHHNISPLSCDMQSDDLHHFVNNITNDCHPIEFPIKWSRQHEMTNMDSPFDSWYQSIVDNKDIFHTKCPLIVVSICVKTRGQCCWMNRDWPGSSRLAVFKPGEWSDRF